MQALHSLRLNEGGDCTLSAEQTWHNACDIKASADEGGLVRGEKKEKWMALCEHAASEQDSEKLMALVAEIDRLFAEKQQRLRQQKSGLDSDVSSPDPA
jgi:hypothetical protein